MDEKELDQLKALSKEIRLQQRYLTVLEKNTRQDAGDDERIADLKCAIRKNLLRCFGEKHRLAEFISGVNDSEIRLIMLLRHVSGFSWDEIAVELSTFDDHGNLTKCVSRTTVMRKYKRYLTRC